MTPPPTLFLQTGFRSGGTWLWSRFRELPQVLAYCEPLNETLNDITQDAILNLTATTSQLNHPTLQEPYFAEFLPLLNETGIGVRHYDLSFGIQSYFDMPERLEASLSVYLNSLVDNAHAQGRQPVLKFTRALGRTTWLRQAFPQARQVLLARAPQEQFLSGWTLFQRTANVTFLMIPLFVVTRLQSEAVRTLCERLAIPCIAESADFVARVGVCATVARELPMASLWAAFLIMFIISHSTISQDVDLVIEAAALGTDEGKRMETALRELSGLHVDLSGYAERPHTFESADAEQELDAVLQVTCIMLETEYEQGVEFTRSLITARCAASRPLPGRSC